MMLRVQTYIRECEQREDDSDKKTGWPDGNGPSTNTDWKWRIRKGTDTNVD